jgi:CheY-like chemotaxis protein
MKGKSIHIVLAYNDETDRVLFTEAFSALAINPIAHIVHDEVQLMDYLDKPNIDLPHLLFLDLNILRKSRLACLNKIKSNEKLKGIAIAIYSISASEKDIEEMFLNGVNVYITKPASFNAFKQALKKTITATYAYQTPPFNKENFFLMIQ